MQALVVDDSRTVRMMVGRILKGLGIEVLEAGHGQEAMERLGGNGPTDIALIDWNMPVMDGLELVKALRADTRYDGMRLMMVTSEAEPAQVVRALMAGADEYLMKPFTQDMIVDKLELLGIGAS